MKVLLGSALISTLVAAAVLLIAPGAATPTPGGLDSRGGHHCWTNCPKYAPIAASTTATARRATDATSCGTDGTVTRDGRQLNGDGRLPAPVANVKPNSP